MCGSLALGLGLGRGRERGVLGFLLFLLVLLDLGTLDLFEVVLLLKGGLGEFGAQTGGMGGTLLGCGIGGLGDCGSSECQSGIGKKVK